MIKTERIDIQWPQCGHDEFKLPENLKDSDFVKCNNCHFEVMLADLKEAGFEQAKEVAIPELKVEAEKVFKNLFKGSKWANLKC